MLSLLLTYMKNLHFLLWAILFPLFMEACSSDELDNTIVQEGNEISKIEAILSPFDVGETESRTAFNFGSTSVDTPVWAEGDIIGIYPSAGGDQLSFPIIDGVGTKTCVFTGGGWALKASTATETYTYTAYSPFNRNYYMLEDNTALPISMLGQKQTGNNNSSHLGAYHIQIANGDTPTSGKISFKFKHKVAFVRMDIVAPCAATWKSITLESNATFTPQATMNLSLDVPTITPVAQSNSVTLELENIKTTANDPSIIAYMVVLPVDFTGKTLTMKLTDSDDNIYTIPASIENPRGVDNPRKFDAASARWISTDFERIRYVTFTADAEQTLTMSKAVGTLQYSVNGSAWNELGTNTIEFGGSKGNLRLRGKSLTGTSASLVDYNNYSTIIFGNNTSVACTGDIRTLIDYENYTTAKTENARFRNLFKNCTCLTTAPDLPAEALADFCYDNMFEGCKSLQEAPQLPAKTIPSGGYYHMFEGCSSLIKAPELPAMTVGNAAYNTMFAGCTSLIDAPELPATTLEGENHYACMFMNCTSLKNIPTILPSMIATSNCYANMFDGCVSITTAPALPATTVSLWCYDSMFKGCVSLINAPEELPATELAPQCYPNMFSGCKNLKKAPKLPATKLTEQCYSGMFSGCTSLETAPELPATTLTSSCYSAMFKNCTSLKMGPKLEAKILVSGCYNHMFYGCSNLNEITMLATQLSANMYFSSCLYEWVKDVPSIGTFYKASAMKSLGQSEDWYDGIPYGWTVKNYGEE